MGGGGGRRPTVNVAYLQTLCLTLRYDQLSIDNARLPFLSLCQDSLCFC